MAMELAAESAPEILKRFLIKSQKDPRMDDRNAMSKMEMGQAGLAMSC
jgi:hypothetical protein